MPMRRFLDGLSRRRVSTAVCLIVPLCLAGAGRWIVWEQLERTDPEANPAPVSLPASAASTALAASVTAILPTRTAPSDSPAPAAREQLALITESMEWVAQAVKRYASVSDYTCTFTKRERLTPARELSTQIMEMKVATRPLSIYFRYVEPSAGREAIWVDGRDDGKLLVHEGGLGRLLAGTLKVDPRSRMALSENRHPITEAGIGFVIDQLADRWPIEMTPELAQVAIERGLVHDGRPAIAVVCLHPEYDPTYLYHKVRVTFDTELSLPVRFEAYGWPESGEPALLEDYAYTRLRLNPGLAARDFDPANPGYAFGRF